MSDGVVAVLCVCAAYLVGAVPFGYLVGRWKGVNLFAVGSGNIGATNAGRVLGWWYGVAVFALDFLKGALPPAAAGWVWEATVGAAAYPWKEAVRVAAAAAAFLGHLYPIYLGFRGGKGIATGAGTIVVLTPMAAVAATAAWVVVVLATRYVSVGSLAATVVLLVVHGASVIAAGELTKPTHWPVLAYLLVGTALVWFKHRLNLRRLWQGQENAIGESAMRRRLLRLLHILALGMWFGGAAFFNWLAAPAIFQSFDEVVRQGPSDRTAGEQLLPPEADEARKKALASALAGAAVGPIFPRYFVLQAVCGVVALLTAWGWRHAENGAWPHRLRLGIIAAAMLGVLAGWPIAEYVSELRLQRYAIDAAVAAAARSAFGPWHAASLLLSQLTTLLAGIALALAAFMPSEQSDVRCNRQEQPNTTTSAAG